MKIYSCWKFGLLLGGVLLASSANSHPYDSPLEFRMHKTNDGRIIYSNIPKKCFNDGRLNCYRLHPIFRNSGAPLTSDPASPSETN